MKSFPHILILFISLESCATITNGNVIPQRPPPLDNQNANRLFKSNRRKSNKNHDSLRYVGGSQERRAIPWVSIALLLKILFFFRSFAAPFFDPLGEPRRATASTIYFSLLAFLYVWLASVTTLTIVPHISTHYNVIIATALFFYMAFLSIGALLAGRFIIRCCYYLYLFWIFKRGKKVAGGAKLRIPFFRESKSSQSLQNGVGNHIQTTFLKSDSILVPSESCPQLGNHHHTTQKRFPTLFAFHRPFRRVFKCAILLSASLCLLYAHCWSRTLSAFKVSRDEGSSAVCRGVFLPLIILFGNFSRSPIVAEGTGSTSSCHFYESCADERFIWIMWACTVVGHLFYYAIHEFSGKHQKGYKPKKSKSLIRRRSLKRYGNLLGKFDDDAFESFDTNDCRGHVEGEVSCNTNACYGGKEKKEIWPTLSSTIQKLSKQKPERPTGTLAMVPWYSVMLVSSGFDILVSLHIFLGRFDARKMQVALSQRKTREKKCPRCRQQHSDDSGIQDSEGFFDFSHCNTMPSHVPLMQGRDGFWFDFMSDCGDGFNSSYQVSRLLAQPTLTVTAPAPLDNSRHEIILPRGRILVIGGDLAYPDPTQDSYENRFFRTFEDALPPPPSFRKEHISIRKPALPVDGWDLEVARSHFNSIDEDGQEEKKCSEYPAIKSEVEDGARLASYNGPCAFAIPGNHDWFDGLATYTRYILSRDWLGGWLMPQRTSYFALKFPRSWWVLSFDLALDNDINIEQFQYFAELAENSMQANDSVVIVTHVPHWILSDYENHTVDCLPETNLRELMRTHLKGKVRLRLAGDLHNYTRHMPTGEMKGSHTSSANENSPQKSIETPALIVSGGGGAFLHPTHCFKDRIKVGEERVDYVRACAYPSTQVSRHLSWLNLWQFRWRNWRLDIIWAVTYFGICSSFFPLCGVYDDYLRFNPDHHPLLLLLWVFSRVLTLIARIFVSGRVSLFFTFFVFGVAFSFTDWSNLKLSTHIGWSLLHAFSHLFSALMCLLFVECMAEFIVSEGLVVTHKIESANTQSCPTGLASSIYDEYTTHFSHVLDDFQLLNSTNSTFFHEPPDLFPSCRFDERLYEIVINTFSWMYNEAPLLKTTLAIFDLPGVIGSTHVEMCNILCSDGRHCTYSHDTLQFQHVDRITIVKYLASIALYFIVFAVPLAGNVFGTWLALTLNILNCQYNEGFSSLRLEHWKNFLRMHIDQFGDLEIFSIGLHRVPEKWVKDPLWGGRRENTRKPSWTWKTPSKWKPERSSRKCDPEIVDYLKIKRRTS